jgi:hypothetical protein
MDMNNGLVDEEKNWIAPLMGIGVVAILAMLAWGLFMPTIEWLW